jgi:glutamate carboxypeptidase
MEDGRAKKVHWRWFIEAGFVFPFEEALPSMNSTEESRELFEKYNLVSQRLGYEKISLLPAELRGGGDISYVASYISTALVGIGANGSSEHSPQETLDVDSLVAQSQRAGLLMLDLIK